MLSDTLPKRSDSFFHKKREKRSAFAVRQKSAKAVKPQAETKQPEDFLGIPCKTVTFKVPPKAEREAMRIEFEQGKRAEFIKYLAETQQDALKRAGITQKQLEGMKRGYTPHGFNTHHKLPIYGGGTNDFSNLVLVRREPWHDMMHYHLINRQTKKMSEGDQRQIVIPDPKTPVFEPAPQYKFLEKWAKKGRKTYGGNKNVTLDEVRKEAKRRAMAFNACQDRGR
ncbi:MAG: HNH endonuclease [Alphaproteobacteria bacterium]|nr:HNH endonuclease [Alphaproteobacteria bacterium]